MRKSLWFVLAVLVAMLCLFPGTSKADGVPVIVGGVTYDITTITGDFSTVLGQVQSTPWWGNQTLAGELANEAGASLGLPNLNDMDGPFFGFGGEHDNTLFAYVYQTNPGSTVLVEVEEGPELSYTWATGSIVAAPEPGSLSMMFSGLLGLGLLVRVKRYRGNRLANIP